MPTGVSLTLSTAIQFLPGVGPDRAMRLQKLGLRTARDLLFFFPKDHEFPAPSVPIPELREGIPASVVGVITDAELVSRTPGKSLFGFLTENESGAIRSVFYNQPFRADTITFGQRVLLSGIPKLVGLRYEFVHPKVTILRDDEPLPQAPILPIYPLTEGIKQADLRKVTRDCITALVDELAEAMPETLRRDAAERLREAGIAIEGDLPGIAAAVTNMHFPANPQTLLAARSRLIYQELIVMQLALAMRRRQLTSDLLAPPLPTNTKIDARIINRFPFTLTADQRRTIGEVASDMARQFPMNRMLQGDVGSGKTVVALYAMLLAIANGHQAVLMAPTEVLAKQHYSTLLRMLTGSRVRLAMLSGSLTPAQRRSTLEKIAAGEVDLVVGTQALVYSGVEFAKLGLCVIDEQHKFGVNQRMALRRGGVAPHCLVMSATPIPRSLAMTLFGDVDLSTLREKPPGRGRVHTYLAHDGWKERWWQFVKQQIAEGRQALVVAPRISGLDRSADNPTQSAEANAAEELNAELNAELNDEAESIDESKVSEIEPSAGEDVASVLQVYDQLRTEIFTDQSVGLLHGKMSGEEKASVMRALAGGSLDVLVSTTVIEVGIDVPNATVLTILGAQRFGLAQLHQLRGRVSRGSHAGHVCVFTDGEQSPEEYERLRVFAETDDGFELAEADFRLRGPGELLGSRQSGMPPLRVADLLRDQVVLQVARQMAQEKLDEDPELADPAWGDLRQQVLRRYGDQLALGETA